MDPFERLANQQISAPIKSRIKAAATRAERKRQKELQERDTLFRIWKKWHEERKAELLNDPAARELALFIEQMTLGNAERLIELVEASPLRGVDDNTRFLMLDLIGRGITYLREASGLDPFDDPLDDEPNAFLIIKELLSGSRVLVNTL
jgi:hypothetical protein